MHAGILRRNPKSKPRCYTKLPLLSISFSMCSGPAGACRAALAAGLRECQGFGDLPNHIQPKSMIFLSSIQNPLPSPTRSPDLPYPHRPTPNLPEPSLPACPTLPISTNQDLHVDLYMYINTHTYVQLKFPCLLKHCSVYFLLVYFFLNLLTRQPAASSCRPRLILHNGPCWQTLNPKTLNPKPYPKP